MSPNGTPHPVDRSYRPCGLSPRDNATAARASRHRNPARRLLPALVSALALLAAGPLTGPLPGPQSGYAQSQSESEAESDAADEATAPAKLDAPLLDASHAKRAHRLAERWVRDAAVPAANADQMPQIRVTGLLGIRVTLRLDGLSVGRADAYRADPEAVLGQTGPSLDLVPLLRRATATALQGVRESLKDAHLKAVTQQFTQDTPAAPELADIAGQLLVDVQLAHSPRRVRIEADAPVSAATNRFAPGYHGLYSPQADASPGSAIVWPATALARHLMPRAQLMQLLNARGRDPQALAQLGRPGGPALARFRAFHVVRPRPHLPPTRLVRGNVLLPPHNISSRTLDGLIGRLANHLEGRFTDKDLVRGTYHPTSNRYDPPLADMRGAGLACYALMRHASQRRALSGADDETVQRMADTARAGAAKLGHMILDQEQSIAPAASALALLTFVDDIKPGEQRALRDKLADHLMSLHRAESGGFTTRGQNNQTQPANEATRALATAALAALYERTRDERVGAVARQEIRALWQQTNQDPNIAALPWFALAHHRAGALLAKSSDADDAPQRLAQRETGLGDLIERLVWQQVVERPVLGPADVVGGFALQDAPDGAPPKPDWRTAQLLAFLALCLREPGVTEDRDALGWLLNAGLAGRYIAQLMMDETAAYYVRSLPDALGGVRLAPWDNRLGVSPTAMSLLACVQLQQTLDHFTPSNIGQ